MLRRRELMIPPFDHPTPPIPATPSNCCQRARGLLSCRFLSNSNSLTHVCNCSHTSSSSSFPGSCSASLDLPLAFYFLFKTKLNTGQIFTVFEMFEIFRDLLYFSISRERSSARPVYAVIGDHASNTWPIFVIDTTDRDEQLHKSVGIELHLVAWGE